MVSEWKKTQQILKKLNKKWNAYSRWLVQHVQGRGREGEGGEGGGGREDLKKMTSQHEILTSEHLIIYT